MVCLRVMCITVYVATVIPEGGTVWEETVQCGVHERTAELYSAVKQGN